MNISASPRRITAAAIAIVLVAAGGVLAHMHVAAQVYHPVVQMASPSGLTFTAVQDETGGRRECGQANGSFITPFKAHCKNCQTIYARCERTLTGLEAAVDKRQSIPHYLVLSPGLRLVVAGPEASAREACDFVAADMVSRGYSTSVCIYPKRVAANGK